MKPKHHLDAATLMSYAAGTLPDALKVVATAHLERCNQCQDSLRLYEQIGGALLLKQQNLDPPSERSCQTMLNRLDMEEAKDHHANISHTKTSIGQAHDPVYTHNSDSLPEVLHPFFGHSLSALRWRRITPFVQQVKAKNVHDGELLMLRIAAKGKLPLHGHQGHELTMILQGAYNDMIGHFGVNDVADLDTDTWHQPVVTVERSCVCVASFDKPLIFSGLYGRIRTLFGK